MRSSFSSRSTWKNLRFSIIVFGIGTIFGAVAGVWLFLLISGGSATPSEPISAPTLSLNSSDGSLAQVGDGAEPALPVLLPTVPAEVSAISAETTPNPVQLLQTPTLVPIEVESAISVEATLPPTAPPTLAPTATSNAPKLYRIDSTRSQARFSVYETFPEGTAIGVTNEIAGDMIVDFETPSNSQVGTIRINLRSLQTDDPDRDRSIRCCVLLTARDEFEFGEFSPTALSTLPSQVEIGMDIPFQVSGNLTVRGVTAPVTFDVNLTLASDDELSGFASTVVSRRDFGILNTQDNGFDYHGVEDEITLEFEFVARVVAQ